MTTRKTTMIDRLVARIGVPIATAAVLAGTLAVLVVYAR